MESAANKPYGFIYCVEHKDSGRTYVGQTVQPILQRWRQHQKSSECARLFRAIKKYGPDAFAVRLLDIAVSADDLDAREAFYIALFRSTDRRLGFNLMSGATGAHKHSEESRQKMSEALRAAWGREDLREQWSAARRVKHSPERAAKVSAALTGKKASEETRRKLSEAKKKLWADPAFHERMQASFNAGKGDEWRAKVAAAAKRQWEDPEKRARAIAASTAGKKAMWADPAKRAAILEKRRATSAAKKSAAPK